MVREIGFLGWRGCSVPVGVAAGGGSGRRNGSPTTTRRHDWNSFPVLFGYRRVSWAVNILYIMCNCRNLLYYVTQSFLSPAPLLNVSCCTAHRASSQVRVNCVTSAV